MGVQLPPMHLRVPPAHSLSPSGGVTLEYLHAAYSRGPLHDVCRYLDGLANNGNADGRAFRDLEWEEKVLNMTRKMGIGEHTCCDGASVYMFEARGHLILAGTSSSKAGSATLPAEPR